MTSPAPTLRIMDFPSAVVCDGAVTDWFSSRPGALGQLALQWWTLLRGNGPDLRELLHDGQPTVCVGTAAVAYVGVYSAHVSIGFFGGNVLADPAGLLEGSGRFMRHVKLRPALPVNEPALRQLLATACDDVRQQRIGRASIP